MKQFDRYFLEIVFSRFLIVLAGFIGMFSLFELIAELGQLGRSGYRLEDALAYAMFRVPALAYDLMPLCALIGGLWGMADLAISNEFTVIRASGYRPRDAMKTMAIASIPLVVAAYVLSEWVMPWSEGIANQVRSGTAPSSAGQALRSGYWLKDNVSSVSGAEVVDRFIGVGASRPNQSLENLRVYEFGVNLELRRFIEAETGEFLALENVADSPKTIWRLRNAEVLQISSDGRAWSSSAEIVELASGIPLDSLSALLVRPEQMAALQLWQYVRYLKAGRQKSARFELALWKKLTYPLSLWAMLALSLPLAYAQTRSGHLGLKVFIGIGAGLVFYLLNSLFAHLTTLGDWPAAAVAVTPSLIALSVVLIVLQIAQRRAL